jgi:hypothetical protein
MDRMKNDNKYIKQLVSDQAQEAKAALKGDKIRISKIILDFIAQNKLIIYGGHALNILMPKNMKIYNEGEFADFDCLSTMTLKHATALTNKLYASGYEYTEMKQALHEGTYKIFVNFEPVADISHISDDLYKTLKHLSLTENTENRKKGLLVAHPYYLKMAMFRELSRPILSLFRWTKVYTRLQSFNTAMYNKKNNRTVSVKRIAHSAKPTYLKHDQPGFTELYNIYIQISDIIKIHSFPVVGSFAIGLHLGKNQDKHLLECCHLDDFFSVFEIVTIDLDKSLDVVRKSLVVSNPNWVLTFVECPNPEEILPKRVKICIEDRITKHKHNLLTMIDTSNSCLSYTKKNGYVLASPFTILWFLYAYWLIYYIHEPPRVCGMIDVLIDMFEDFVYKKIPQKDKFIRECFGNNADIVTRRKEAWMSKKSSYKPMDGNTSKSKN